MSKPPHVQPDFSELKEWDLGERRALLLFESPTGVWSVLEVNIKGLDDGKGGFAMEILPSAEYIPFEFRGDLKKGVEGFKYRIQQQREDDPSIQVVVLRGAYHRKGQLIPGFNTTMQKSLRACFYPPSEVENHSAEKALLDFNTNEKLIEEREKFKQEREAAPAFISVQNWDLSSRTAIVQSSRERTWAVLEIRIQGIDDGKGQFEIDIEPSEEYLPDYFRGGLPKGVDRFYWQFMAYRSDSPSLNITVTRACYHRSDSSKLAFELGMLKALRACFLPQDKQHEAIAELRLKQFMTDAQLAEYRRKEAIAAERYHTEQEDERKRDRDFFKKYPWYNRLEYGISLGAERLYESDDHKSKETSASKIKVRYKDGSETETDLRDTKPRKRSLEEYIGIALVLIINLGILVALLFAGEFLLSLIPLGLLVFFIWAYQNY